MYMTCPLRCLCQLPFGKVDSDQWSWWLSTYVKGARAVIMVAVPQRCLTVCMTLHVPATFPALSGLPQMALILLD